MASSTVVANLINREVENSDAWSLGCDITIEEMDVVVEEIKLNDIAIAGVVKTNGISVDIDHDKNNVMDLDVNVVIDGLNSSIVESQVVPYERVVEINDLSPESSYEKGFAASAKSVKKVKDSVDSLDNNVKSNTSNISKVATDIESLTRRVDRLSMSEGGEDLGGIWYIDELTGNLVTDKQVEIKSNLIVAGDTSTGRTGEDPGTTGIDEEQLQDYLDEHKYITSDYPYSKQEVDNKIEGIDVSGQINNALTDYAKTEDVNNALENKADKTELDKYLLKKAESQEIEGDITIKGNLIITGDTSTGGTGQDVPSGIDEAQLKEYLDTNKYITSDYAYSKEETASEISNAIAGIDIPSLDGYATEQFVTDSITALNVGQYATKTALETLQGEVDNIEAVLGMDEEAEGIINTWNEVKAFLAEIEVGDDLASILEGINTRIGNNTTAIGLIDGRVTVNEAAISDNATNIKNLKDSVYTKDDLATYKAWWDDVMSLVVKDGNNIKINTNLIVTGDTASGARGTNSGTDGTLIGVIVNGTRYEDETNGMLDLSTLMNQYALATAIPTSLPASDVYAWAKKSSLALADVPDLSSKYLSTAGGTLTGALTISTNGWNNQIVLNGVDSNAGIQFKYSNTLMGSLYAAQNELYWLKGSTANKMWHAGNFNPADYLPKSGGTIDGSTLSNIPLTINSNVTSGTYLRFNNNATYKVAVGWNSSDGAFLYNKVADRLIGVSDNGTPYFSDGTQKALIHSGGGKISTSDFAPLDIDRDATSGASAIAYSRQGSTLGYLGFNDSTGPRWWDTSYTPYTLIHSGNIGNYTAGNAWALRINEIANVNDAITQSFFMAGFQAANRPDTSQNYSTGITLHNNTLGYTYQLAYSTSNALYSRRKGANGWESWKTIAFTDSNVASATKLQTARTIWGQSFDGTGDIANSTNGTMRRLLFHDVLNGSGTTGYIGRASSTNNDVYVNSAHDLRLMSGDNYTMWLNASGNVTIGARDLAGTTYKLHVDGKIRATSAIYNNRWVTDGAGAGFVSNKGGTYYFGFGASATNGDNVSFGLCKDTAGAWQQELMTFTESTGNVLIGTTTDSGYKLDVNGDISIAKGYSLRNGNHALIGRNSGDNVEINAGATARDSITTIYGTYIVLSPYRGATSALSIAPNGAVTMSSTLSVSDALTSKYITFPSVSYNATFYKNTGGGRIGCFDFPYSVTVQIGGNGETSTDKEFCFRVLNNAWNKDLFHVGNSGKVGIGIETPEAELHVKGNAIITGDTGTGSDIRFKDKLSNHRIALSDIADAPLFTFKWNDREDDSVHLGSSAQYWEKVAPWLVKGEDFKTLDYSTLGVAIGISLANKTLNLEDRVKILEKENKALKEQIRRIQYGS